MREPALRDEVQHKLSHEIGVVVSKFRSRADENEIFIVVRSKTNPEAYSTTPINHWEVMKEDRYYEQ